MGGQLKLGRFFYSTTDLSVPLAGIPIQITRTYDTLTSNYSGDFGFGWTLSGVEARVQTSQPKSQSEELGVPDIFGSQGGSFRIGTTVTITGPDGKRETFTFVPVFGGGDLFGAYYLSAYQPEQGVYDTLTDTPPNTLQTPLQINGDSSVGGFLFDTSYEPGDFYLTTKDGHVYHYTPSGGLVDEHDRNGVSLTFTHTGIFSSTGASISYTRDPVTDRISAITDPNGNKITYAYDNNGNLISKTDQAGRKNSYSYLSTPAHYLNQLLDANGNPFSKTAFDGSGRLSSFTDALGNITTFIYDPVALTQTTIEPLDPATNTNPTEVTFYDSKGNITQVTNEIGSVSSATYDVNNNPLVVIPPCGCKTTYTYDNNGNQLTKTDPLGNVTTFTYDNNNDPTSITDPRGYTTTYQYDDNGNLSSAIDPLGNKTQLGNDSLGRPVSLTDALGHVTQFTYIDDPSTGIAAAKPSIVTNNDGSILKFTYNQFGSPTTAIDENGNTIQLTTDNAGILQQRIEANGSTSSYSYDGNGNLITITDGLGKVTNMKYDAGFNLVERDGPNGEVTKFGYDQLNRLSTKTDPLNRVTTRHYRADSALSAITEPDGTNITFDLDTNGRRTGLTDPTGNHTTFTYSGDSQVLTKTDPLGKTTTYSYDPSGNLNSVTDRLGRIRQFAYDSTDKLLTETWFVSGTTNPIKTINLGYDALSNLQKAYDDTGSIALQYDPRNRLKTETTNYKNQAGFVLNYGYDLGSRVTTVTDGDGMQVGTAYDQQNNISQLIWQGTGISARVNFTYDLIGDLTNIKRYADTTGSHFIGQTTYNFTRNLTNTGYAAASFNSQGDDSGTASFEQTEAFGPLQNGADSSNLLASGTHALARTGGVTHQDGLGNVINSETYTNDIAGELSTKTLGSDVTTFGYDQIGQLLSANHSQLTNLNENYTYDLAGNRTLTNSQTIKNTIGSGNRIMVDYQNSYLYDYEGNLISKISLSAGTVWNYSYDHRNRMTSAVEISPSGTILSQSHYTYDPFNHRISKNVNGQTTSFFYNGDDIWKQSTSSDTTHYLNNGEVDGWLARANSTGTNWYLSDRLGSITGLTDSNGNVINTNTYDSYGRVLYQTNPSVADSLTFTGREYDSETGLFYFRARYYSPDLGRFISEDPIGFDSCDDNIYRFTENSPTGYTDPSGTTLKEYTASTGVATATAPTLIAAQRFALLTNQASRAVTLTAAQINRIGIALRSGDVAKAYRFFKAFCGSQLDKELKILVRADPYLRGYLGLGITGLFKRGPDFFGSIFGASIWFDLTTASSWAAHVARYASSGQGFSILYKTLPLNPSSCF